MVVGAVAGRAAEATAVTRLGVRGMMGGGNSPDVFWRFLPPRIGIHRQEIDDVGPVLLDAQVSSMVFLIRDLLYVSLLLEHNRGAGRSEPSEWGGQLLSPRAPGAGPPLSSAGSPLSKVGQSASYFASISRAPAQPAACHPYASSGSR
jgi:hypothetical protein